MSRKDLIVRGFLIGALASCIFVPTLHARSVKATLYTNQTREATYPLARDEKNGFLLTGGVLASSKHDVRYYYGGSASTWRNDSDPSKYALTAKRVWLVGKGQYKTLQITPKMCKYDFVKVCMYGNSEVEPKKKCYADAVLTNH